MLRTRVFQFREEEQGEQKQQLITASAPVIEGSGVRFVEDEDEEQAISKKKLRKMNRLTVAQLKQVVDRPDVVEMHDVNSADPKTLIHLKVCTCVRVHVRDCAFPFLLCLHLCSSTFASTLSTHVFSSSSSCFVCVFVLFYSCSPHATRCLYLATGATSASICRFVHCLLCLPLSLPPLSLSSFICLPPRLLFFSNFTSMLLLSSPPPTPPHTIFVLFLLFPFC